MFHINPDSQWLWSVLLGIGVARDEVWYEKGDEHITQAEFAEGVARMGIGLERRFGSWGLAAQLYGVGMSATRRSSTGRPTSAAMARFPEKSSGGMFQLVANWYF